MRPTLDSNHADLLSVRLGLVKPHKVVMMVFDDPPPAPACWTNERDWRDWLLLTYAAGESITRRRDLGKYRGEREVTVVFRQDLDFCSGCTHRHKAAMERAGRCFPSKAERARELEPVEMSDTNEQLAVAA